MNLRFPLLLIFLTHILLLCGQSTVGDSLYRDQFKLKNGLVFNGNLISFDDKQVVIGMKDGSQLRFNHTDLVWIKQYGRKLEKHSLDRPKEFIYSKSKNYFVELGIGILTGGGRNTGFLTGGGYYGGIQKKIGNKLSSTQLVGLSTGYEVVSGFADYITVPLTLGYTNMWVLDGLAPYLSGKIGYGFASVDDSQWWGGSEERMINGGLRYELSVGSAFRLGNGAALNLQGGYIKQKYHYVESSLWWGTNDVRETLNRLFLRIGIQF
jgi:hypothetical protein